MTQVASTPLSSTARPVSTSFVEWGAVLAGAVLAAAIAFVLLTFGTAIGLSATSPWPSSGLSAKVIASLSVFWAMATQIGAFMAGGYVAGRMRARLHETAEHEVEFRDGLHGGLVWAVGVIISAVLVTATTGLLAKTGAEIAGQAATAAASSANDPIDIIIDAMVRPPIAASSPPPASASTPAAPPQTPGATRARGAALVTSDERGEIARILASSVASGSLSDSNRVYLVQLVSQRAAVSQQEAEKRVNDALNAAREAADKARRAAVLTGFVTAASLMISFTAAWWAALKGGQHRYSSIPATFFGERRRRVIPMA